MSDAPRDRLAPLAPGEWNENTRRVFTGTVAAGLDEDEIDRVAIGADASGWSEPDAWLLRAADELHASQDLTQRTWLALRERHDEAQLLEIPFVVGQYTMLSMVANATGVPVEEECPPLPTV